MAQERDDVRLNGPDGAVVSRRAFLRGSLLSATIAGTGAFSGCMTPTPPVAAAPAPAPAGPPVVARGPGPAISENVPKRVARYQDFPNGPQRCGRCVHFLPPGRCEIVAGRISPRGWCRFFEAMA
jgi:hypothetical protein